MPTPTVPSLLVALLTASLAPAATATTAQAATDPVTAMSAPLYQRVQPSSGANLVTPWAGEASTAASTYGFTTDLGRPFRAATSPSTGLTPVHRLFKSSASDFAWALEGSSQLSALATAGYTDQGTNFYASATDLAERTEPVQVYGKGTVHRLALAASGSTLVSQGWSLQGTAFFVPTMSTSTAPAPVTTNPVTPGPVTGTAGSATVGSTSYPVPAGAIRVSTRGDDLAPGTAVAPVRSIARAIALAPSGGTIVVSGGAYHESLVIQGKALTIQNAPGEAVWLDGSQRVDGWVQDGTAWRRDGWTTRFDHSPTYTQGAADSTTPFWQFVNTQSYPMAAHPDQVFVDGTALRQVQYRSQVAGGTFYLDEGTSRLYVGTQPAGHVVEASTLAKALSIRGGGSVVRGIGIRRFAPSVFMLGAVTVEAPRVHLENVVIDDSATTGLSVQREDAVVDHVTVQRSGMLGIHSRFADRIALTNVRSAGNNVERFNIAPVSGGAKLSASRGVTVRNSVFSGNYGPGLWTDQSVYDTTVSGSMLTDNAGDGLFLEISAKAVVGDNVFARNAKAGLKVANTSDVKIWNNSFLGSVRPINLTQDSRRNTNPNDSSVDPRIPFPDPAMTWTLGPVVIRNNVISQPTTGGNCVLCVEDYSKQETAAQMGVSANGNVYHRRDTATPTWLVVWSRGSTDPSVFTSLTQMVSTTGQERRGREFVGTAVLSSTGVPTSAVASLAPSVAEALPSDVAARIGRPAGSVHLGIW
ncbi:right-handed parallel beta-helix repeat-containing protein [Pedococcus sp. KACC 23699]|uniref:Right-handed parallel beta-helix repeat-containing protein n=1 Tax=Pedococcus sp. KACC 23699 TaxID=3149228 RepID=A0AAU7JXG8_9MICO